MQKSRKLSSIHVLSWLIVFTAFTCWSQAVKRIPSPRSRCEDVTQPRSRYCADEQYRQADANLNATYRTLETRLKADVARYHSKGPEGEQQWRENRLVMFRNAQKSWIAYRDEQCKGAQQQYQGGTIAPIAWADCMNLLTVHRIAEMKQTYEIEPE